MSGDSEGKRRSMSDSSADNRDALRENKITSKFNEGSGQTKVRSDSTCSVGSGVPPVKKEEEEEEVVKLRWALEDSSVPVSRRLAGCELYDRVLALRGILSLRTDSTPLSDAEERPAATPSESERKENSNATLDEILASLVQPAGVTGGSGGDESLDERAAVNVDDFFGSFTGHSHTCHRASSPLRSSLHDVMQLYCINIRFEYYNCSVLH